jgi:OTU domain-containing protein 6
LEEPLGEYVRKIRETGEWGGQLELMALAKTYGIDINVLQGDGRVEKIEGAADGNKDEKVAWLAYYKHGFGLGEHYNSLRKS